MEPRIADMSSDRCLPARGEHCKWDKSSQAAAFAGVEGAVIIGKLLEKSEAEGTGATLGYNAATGVYEDLVKAGIIDPLKVCSTLALHLAS